MNRFRERTKECFIAGCATWSRQVRRRALTSDCAQLGRGGWLKARYRERMGRSWIWTSLFGSIPQRFELCTKWGMRE